MSAKDSTFENSMNHGSAKPKPILKEKPKPILKEKAKPRFSMPLLVKCKNSKCPYYLTRHRRFYWFTKSKLDKPSCPKCFGHHTQFVSSDEAKKLGI